jgi:hypothetical protein
MMRSLRLAFNNVSGMYHRLSEANINNIIRQFDSSNVCKINLTDDIIFF